MSVVDKATDVFRIVSPVIWGVYCGVGLDNVAKVFVPGHTREAAFQLFCDLRTTSPKDARFWKHHAKALQPHTALGWLAAGSALLSASASTAVATAITLSISVAAINIILFLSVVAGVTVAVVLGCCSVGLFVCACFAGCTAFTAAITYSGLASTKFVVTSAARLLLGSGSDATARLEGSRPPQLLSPVPEEASEEQLQEQRQLDADTSAAAEALAAKLQVSLSALPGANPQATAYALQKLGLAPPSPNRANEDAASQEPPPASGNGDPRAVHSGQSTQEAATPYRTPTKKRRAGSGNLGGNAEAGSGVATPSQQSGLTAAVRDASAASDESDDSQVHPDILASFDQGFMGSPGSRTPNKNGSRTPSNHSSRPGSSSGAAARAPAVSARSP